MHAHNSHPLNFDPVHTFAMKLQRCLEPLALLFWDPLGGDRIGLVWNPLAFAAVLPGAVPPHALSTALRLKKDAEGKVQPSKAARPHLLPNIFSIVSDIRELGGPLIHSINLKPKSSSKKI